MILVEFCNAIDENFKSKYKDKINIIDYAEYQNEQWPVNLIENIKKSELSYSMTIIPLLKEIILCLDALNIEYDLIYYKIDESNIDDRIKEDYIFVKSHNCNKIILDENDTIENTFKDDFDWIKIEEPKQLTTIEESKPEVPLNKNKLTLSQLIDDDLEITEADVRELKATQNKLKVGMLLQAKNSLNRVLKLSNTLDKLYDKLLERIDNGLDTTDTASLMYTTEYIAKALADTNQFIVSLISNEKIQNFFIIDNSSVVNVSSNDRVDINSREKIRKAAEIVLDNIDYFAQGDFQSLKNPNIIDVSEVQDNVSDKS